MARAKVKPTAEQAKIAELFPAVAKYVEGYGHIEIGAQETSGFIVRALDYGGMVFEDDKPRDSFQRKRFLARPESALALHLRYTAKNASNGIPQIER